MKIVILCLKPSGINESGDLLHVHGSKVHRTMWYMFHYNGPTPKRHLAFANSSAIGGLDCGPLVGWKKIKKEREAKGEAPPQLVQKYHDKQGKLRYKGLPALRSSECRPHLIFIWLGELFSDIVGPL